MNFDEYQKQALTTVVPTGDDKLDLAHFALGLTGESGEIAEKVKKVFRDKKEIDDTLRQDLKKEIGDVLWYAAVLADHLGLNLDEIAQANVEKLKSRQARNVLTGSGDDR